MVQVKGEGGLVKSRGPRERDVNVSRCVPKRQHLLTGWVEGAGNEEGRMRMRWRLSAGACGGRCCRELGWSLLGEELESVCGHVVVVVSPGLHCGPGEG